MSEEPAVIETGGGDDAEANSRRDRDATSAAGLTAGEATCGTRTVAGLTERAATREVRAVPGVTCGA